MYTIKIQRTLELVAEFKTTKARAIWLNKNRQYFPVAKAGRTIKVEIHRNKIA